MKVEIVSYKGNFAQSPPTVQSNCSERLWLDAKTFLVAPENRFGWLGESN